MHSLYNGQNLDYTGSASANPYKLIQQGGKHKKSKRSNKSKQNKRTKRNRTKKNKTKKNRSKGKGK
jgi:hypothetical protein